MRNLTVIMLLTGLLLGPGCQVVHVQDNDGKAIVFATVSSGVQGSKFASMPARTDMLGNALLPLETTGSKDKWIAISKEGYIPIRIARPAEGKIEITLRKANSSGRGFTSKRASSGRGVSETTRLRASPTQAKPAKIIVPRRRVTIPPAGE
jgi:hypothetical protein